MGFNEELQNIPPDELSDRFTAEMHSGPYELRAPIGPYPHGAYDGPIEGGYQRYVGEHSEALKRLLTAMETDVKRSIPLDQVPQVMSYAEAAILALCTYADSTNAESNSTHTEA